MEKKQSRCESEVEPSSKEMRVFELLYGQHVIPILIVLPLQFILLVKVDLTEPVKVQLAHKAIKICGFEVMGQHLLCKCFRILMIHDTMVQS